MSVSLLVDGLMFGFAVGIVLTTVIVGLILLIYRNRW